MSDRIKFGSCKVDGCDCGQYSGHVWLQGICTCIHQDSDHENISMMKENAESEKGAPYEADVPVIQTKTASGNWKPRVPNQGNSSKSNCSTPGELMKVRAASTARLNEETRPEQMRETVKLKRRPQKPLPKVPIGDSQPFYGFAGTTTSTTRYSDKPDQQGNSVPICWHPLIPEHQMDEKAQKRLRHRRETLQEVLDTERVFVRNLKALVKIFLHPLQRRAGTTMQALSIEQVTTIFSNCEMLYNINQELLKNLEDRYRVSGADMPCIGDIFLSLTPYFKMYTQYINNYETSRKTVAACSKEPAFLEFLEKTKAFPECAGRDLNAFLIMPVQRVPRYGMLLQDLLNHTDETHPDHKKLSAAAAKVQELALAINESKRHMENLNTIVELAQRFSGKVFDHLIAPHRVFLREGILWKKPSSSKRGKDKKRVFHLFSDCIVYSERTIRDMFDYKGKINLNAAMVADMPDSKDLKNAFKIVSTSGTYVIYADNKEDKESWVNDIKNVVVQLQENQIKPLLGKQAEVQYAFKSAFQVEQEMQRDREQSTKGESFIKTQ